MRRLLTFRRPSTGTVLAGVALFIALGGTALAATGQLVNIADGTNAGNLAKVDGTGALRTTAIPPVVPGTGKVWSTYGYASHDTYGAVTQPTMATVALNHISVVNDLYAAETLEVRLYSITVPAGSACSLSSAYADTRSLGRYQLDGHGTVVDPRSTPLVLRPVGTRPWCLVAGNFSADGTSSAYPAVTLAGYVVSGTPPVGTVSRTAARRAGAGADPLEGR